MNNQQQTPSYGDKVATKLINKLAIAELETAKREVEIDDLKEKVQQLTQANQQLSAENQQLKQQTKIEEK